MTIIIVWTLVALIGATVAAWNLRDAYADLKALDPAVLNGRRILNLGWVRREAVRLGIQVTWVIVGILSWLRGPVEVNPIVILLLATSVATMVNTILDAHERRMLRRIIGGQP